MGNTLCKERIERADNPKSSVDRVIGRCAQLCPSSRTKTNGNNNYWQRHVLETRPPGELNGNGGGLTAKSGEWRSATLQPTSTTTAQPTATNDIPIAPPRRKRNSLQTTIRDGRPGGFKDVFGNFTRRSSCESTQSVATDWKKRRNSSADIHSDEFCDFSKDLPTDDSVAAAAATRPVLRRKISKVGNKKSDKFFGENLSDCLSDEPVVTVVAAANDEPVMGKEEAVNVTTAEKTIEKDELDTFIERNIVHKEGVADQPQESVIVSKEIEMLNVVGGKSLDMTNSSLDKKAEFLLAMLMAEHQNTESAGSHQQYERPKPVAEEVIVPKRKHGRHICDDDEKLKLIFQTVSTDGSKNSNLINHHHPGQDTVDGAIKSLESSEMLAKRTETIALERTETVTPPPSPTTPTPYEHMQPVDEPIIVPRRSVRKHICDDDDHMHRMVHHHHHLSNEKLAVTTKPIDSASLMLSPKKPDRDFSRYRKSLDLSTPPPQPPSVERPARRSVSRENLPTPPPRPCKTNSLKRSVSAQPPPLPPTSSVPTKRPSTPPPPHPPHQILLKSSSHNDTTAYSTAVRGSTSIPPPLTPMLFLSNGDDEKIVSILKKCNSNHSFLTPDLMDQIVNKVYGFKMNWDDHDSTYYGAYNDCSGEVAPNSKLKTRKISTIRNVEKPIAEEVEEPSQPPSFDDRPTFSIGGAGIVKSDKNFTDLTASMDTAADNSLSSQSDATVVYSISTGTSEVINPTTARGDSFEAPTIPTLSGEQQPQIIQRSSTVLEIQPPSSNKKSSNGQSENIANLINTLTADADMNSVLEGIYSKNKSILGDFQQYLEEAQFNDKLLSALTKQQGVVQKAAQEKCTLPESIPIVVDATDSDASGGEDVDDDDDSNTIKTPPEWRTHLKKTTLSENRRGSIVEHDEWFSEHRGESDIRKIEATLQRRGSYDTRKLFPFGRRDRTLSESSDFFIGNELKALSKSSDHINSATAAAAAASTVTGDRKETSDNSNKDDQIDHSTLLKFFDKNATAV